MDKFLKRQLFLMAFITTPFMALMLATPVYALNNFHGMTFFMMFGAINGIVFMNWMFNIALMIFVPKNWAKTWIRTLVVSSIVISVSFVIFYVFKPKVPIESFKLDMIRVVNIIAVNTIIYVLIDLTLTKDNKHHMTAENARLKLLNVEAEYKLLKDQINPHFLFNALSTAKALVKLNPDLAESYLIRLSEFLRVSIGNTTKTSSLKDEISLCKDYISLQQIRFGDALLCEFDIEQDLAEKSLPFFSLLTLLENAIKHNALTLENPLKIRVEAKNNQVIVSNNKQAKFVLGESTKTGLKNLNERYKLLSGKDIEISETESTYSVRLELLKK